MNRMNSLLAVALFANLPAIAEAAEFGDIRGVLEDTDGMPVPNAEITLKGPNVPMPRTENTAEDGSFSFRNLPPGTYDVEVVFQGKVVTKGQVDVALNAVTRANLTANLNASDATIDVFGVRPAMDTTSSALSTSLSAETIQNMPVGRTFTDVVNTLPGVYGRVDTQNGGGGGANPSVRGEGQYGNNYTIDGISVRDPATNTVAQSVNFDAIEEVQVYTDGAPAEFGQFTGMAVNVSTKDGGNEHHGSAAIFYSQHAWFNKEYDILDTSTGEEAATTKRRFRSPNLALTAGGPIIQDKLWYFAALTTAYDWRIPEGGDTSLSSFGGQGMGKLTYFLNDTISIRYNFTAAPDFFNNFDNDPLTNAEAQTDRRDMAMSHMLKVNIAPSQDTQLEVYGGLTQNTINVVPVSGDAETPSRRDFTGGLFDNAEDYDFNTRARVGGGLRFTQFLNAAGEHRIKAGADAWFLKFNRELRHTGETEIEWIDSDGNPTGEQTLVGTEYSANPEEGYDCTQPDGSDCYYREHWVNVGPLGNTVSTYSAFLQDDWTIADQLTLNIGARVDIEDGRNDEGNSPTTQLVDEFTVAPEEREVGELGARVMPAPRVGFSWDVLGQGHTKVFAHAGRYYDLAGGDFWEWSNARSSAGFVRYTRDADGNWIWSNTQDPEGHPLIYAAGVKPAHMDKAIAGVEHVIADEVVVSLRGILSKTANIPEDIDVNLDDWYIMNSPLKERNYRGLEVAFQRRHDGNWGFYGSYTLSESFGHTPGQFELASGASSGSNGNNVGVYLDDIGEQADRAFFYDVGYGWLLEGLKGLGRYSVTDDTYNDDGGFFGYLPYHSFHALKLNGSYSLPFGTTLGLVYEFDSGHAWQKRTLIPFYGYDGMQEGRGTRFMPASHYVDVRVAHMFEFDEHKSLELSLDIFNMPGFKAPITYFENDTVGFGKVMFRQSPRGIRAGVKMRY
ncbi:MAG: TonB-dependent receptor [Deltaproteobacteria bacterium]|nr:MAG: TonB-dependent receptor [Deltaproteobacteria bacterium]